MADKTHVVLVNLHYIIMCIKIRKAPYWSTMINDVQFSISRKHIMILIA